MRKKKFYKSFFNRRKKQFPIKGVYAKDRSEFKTFMAEPVRKFERKKVRGPFIAKITGLLKNVIVTEFIQATQWELGEKINLRNRNLDVIYNSLMGIRKQHAVYNIHILIINLRILLRNLTVRMLYRKKCLINYVENQHIKKTSMVQPIEQFPTRELMVTWNKWLGGVLTNFKHISKRIMVKLRSKNYSPETLKYYVSYGKDLPKIPQFVISTGECFWAINESNRIRIKSLQLINTTHLGPQGEGTLAMSTNYFALRSFTALVQECASYMLQTDKLFYKRKTLRYLRKQAKRKYYRRKLKKPIKLPEPKIEKSHTKKKKFIPKKEKKYCLRALMASLDNIETMLQNNPSPRAILQRRDRSWIKAMARKKINTNIFNEINTIISNEINTNISNEILLYLRKQVRAILPNKILLYLRKQVRAILPKKVSAIVPKKVKVIPNKKVK